MEASDKVDKAKVASLMRKSFNVTPSEAYRQFKSRKLLVGETPEAYPADLRRMLVLAGHADTGEKDAVVIEQFVAGLPSEFQKELRLSSAGKEFSVSECVDKVRALRAVTLPTDRDIAAAAAGAGDRAQPPARSSKGLCFQFGEPGHIGRDCPGRCGKGFQLWDIVCSFCEDRGHIKKDCEARKTWLASQKVSAAATSDQRSDECLCTPEERSNGRVGLPRVFVDVRTDGNERWERLRAVIDTGSSRYFVSRQVVSHLDGQMFPYQTGPIVSLDGATLDVQGMLQLKYVRDNGAVSIPETLHDTLVLPELSTINADVLLGADFVSACGGLKLGYKKLGVLESVFLGPQPPVIREQEANVCEAVDDDVNAAAMKLSRHVTVTKDGEDVVLTVNDGEARWKEEEGFWEVAWQWSSGE